MSQPAPHSPDRATDSVRLELAPTDPLVSGEHREHAFRSLIQLGTELAASLSLYETVDLLLFNLMGQFRTTRAAVWLLGSEPPTPVLVRCRGLREQAATAVAASCEQALRERFTEHHEPILAWALKDTLGSSGLQMLERFGIALFAPVTTRQELLGWVALGSRLDGATYSSADLEILQSSLAIAGASIQNANLYSRVLEANRSLRSTNERLSELDLLKTNFLSNISHELRTPLAGVIGALGCIDMAQYDPESSREMIDLALTSANKLLHLLEGLLALSDMRHDRLPFQIVETDLAQALKACCESRLPGVNEGLRELGWNLAPDLPRGRVDVQRLGQIIDELIDNAVKFTPRGCHVRVTAGRHEDAGRSWARIDVTDDGPGFPEGKAKLLFEVFEQGDGSSTRRVGGLGMGLALAKDLAEHMDCRLSAVSSPGKGSTFTLLVPAA